MRLATRAQNAQNQDHYGGYFTSIEAAAARAEELRRELHTLDIG